jgi:hypothetical protein
MVEEGISLDPLVSCLKAGVVLMMSAVAVSMRVGHDEDEMLYDTGASHHVVKDLKWLHDARDSEIKQVELGGGETHVVVKEGEVELNNDEGFSIR